MFSQFGAQEKAAVTALKRVVDRLDTNGGWAPIGGDNVELNHAVGQMQTAELIPVGDLRNSPTVEEYVHKGGPMAFSASLDPSETFPPSTSGPSSPKVRLDLGRNQASRLDAALRDGRKLGETIRDMLPSMPISEQTKLDLERYIGSVTQTEDVRQHLEGVLGSYDLASSVPPRGAQ